ncbi:MAG: 16S rRNA (guanine(966)-N(2))-methyltransferase RsmD [Solirubrobacteraceae bacterium]
MRVIAGSHGGRELAAPRGRATRPTSERVREALFSILGDVGGVRVLDLFAGSGALAIEALSRGAGSATLVDRAAAPIAAMQRNLAALAIEAEVVRRPALEFLRTARADARQYDLVFLDPPYSQAVALGPRLTRALAPVLAASGRVVAESDRRSPLALALDPLDPLDLLDERRYGDTLIRIYAAKTTPQR